jgi:hypothetical protein
MRIRSIKPEFWRSEDIARLPKDVRLLFIGLWSYVDDNGVGVDDYRQIAADLFALDDNPVEARNFVRDGLATLSRALLITRYEDCGKPFLFITSWDKHQRVDRPGKQRYNRPEDAVTSDNSSEGTLFDISSRQSREGVATGEGEKGRRGEGENPSGAPAETTPPGPKVAKTPPTADADEVEPLGTQQIVGAWIDACRKRPPQRVIGHISRDVKAMLAEGIDTADVQAGLMEWHTKGLNPSTLASVVHEVMNRSDRRHLRAVSGGYQPFRNPTDPSVYDEELL